MIGDGEFAWVAFYPLISFQLFLFYYYCSSSLLSLSSLPSLLSSSLPVANDDDDDDDDGERPTVGGWYDHAKSLLSLSCEEHMICSLCSWFMQLVYAAGLCNLVETKTTACRSGN